MELFQNIKSTNTVGGYPFPTTGHDFQHLWSGVQVASGVPIQLGREYAVAVRDGKFLSSIEIMANLDSRRASDWTDEPCKRDNYLWKKSVGRAFSDVNCVSINHVVNYFVDPTGEFQKILFILKDKDLVPPPTIIKVSFIRYSINGGRLMYSFSINPEQYGIARDASIPWGSNSWHKNFINRDINKLEFINRLEKWAVDFQNRMNAAFDKQADAFAGIKQLDDYLIENKVGDTTGMHELSPVQQ